MGELSAIAIVFVVVFFSVEGFFLYRGWKKSRLLIYSSVFIIIGCLSLIYSILVYNYVFVFIFIVCLLFSLLFALYAFYELKNGVGLTNAIFKIGYMLFVGIFLGITL